MWARVCVDVNDRADVLGWSIEVHHADELVAVHVFPCGPFDDPTSSFASALEWLHERYGEQLRLTLS